MQAIHKLLQGCALLALLAGLGSRNVSAQAPFNTYVVQDRPILTSVTLGGTVIPSKEVTLSAQVPGRVNLIAGEEGASFDKEAVLVTIDDRELVAQRRAAMAELANAESTLRNADIQFSKELWSPDSVAKAPGGMGVPYMFDQLFTEKAQDMVGDSDSGLDREATLHTYSTQVEQARNSMMRARAQIEGIDSKLRDARSLAPFDGIIIKKLVEVGDTVQPGMPLLKFADVKNLQIQIEVPARLVRGLQVGAVLPAKLDVGGWGQVRVAQVFPIADPDRHTVTVKFDLPPGVQTGPGQYAQVGIQDMSAPAQYQPVVPNAAIIWRGSLPSVYVVAGNKRELRMVRIGNTYGNDVTILSGLKAGETVEVNPQPGTSSGFINENSQDR